MNDSGTDKTTTTPQSSHTATPTEMIKTYDDVTVTGSVAEKDSKVYAYFMSHYQDDYYRVNELEYSIVMDGNYAEYYETQTLAYSKSGYIYTENAQCQYSDKDYSVPIVNLYTPEKTYTLYPEMQTYLEADGNTKNYTNTVDFPGDTMKTGTININGRDYYYEECTDGQITYRYCFDANGELVYNIASSASGTITTRYVEYSKDVDYSLFEIPEGYTLETFPQ